MIFGARRRPPAHIEAVREAVNGFAAAQLAALTVPPPQPTLPAEQPAIDQIDRSSWSVPDEDLTRAREKLRKPLSARLGDMGVAVAAPAAEVIVKIEYPSAPIARAEPPKKRPKVPHNQLSIIDRVANDPDFISTGIIPEYAAKYPAVVETIQAYRSDFEAARSRGVPR